MISQHAMQSIGWALIHSLWQGLAIYLAVKITFRAINKAGVRYGIGVVSMLLMVASSVATFFILNRETTTDTFLLTINISAATGREPGSVLQVALNFIDQNIIWLLRFWVLGLVVGLLRMAAGLWYINRLRSNSFPASDEFNTLLKDLSAALHITKAVTIAEAAIASPMVVGFVKPMILFPIGLLAGLTTEQVETILVHELSHVRRQDYIINLVQSVIETIFFFNPFALLISSLIREERENCCDDVVIAKGVNPVVYVKTLAQLEAVKSSSSLALGIAGNQNQLLNRIKRIMENSAKNDWGKGRLVPVALLFLGLMCASWLSIGSEKKEQAIQVSSPKTDQVLLVSDTAKKKIDTRALAQPEAEEMPIPEELPVPDMAPEFFEFPPAVPGFEYEFFEMDSIPGYRFHFRDSEDWESFEREFTEKFKERFKDFYSKNQKQFDKMLEEMKESGIERDHARAKREAAEVVDLQNMLLRKAEMNAMHNQDIAINLEELAVMSSKIQADQAMQAEMFAKIAANQNLEMLQDQIHQSSDMYEDMARRYDEFHEALVKRLVEDGYIKAGEKVDQLQINELNGQMSINGKSIREKDRIKYKALQDQYFKTKRVPIIPGRSE